MAVSKIKGASIRGVCCALPNNKVNVFDQSKKHFDEKELRKACNTIGVESVYYAKDGQTASDIGIEAAKKLILDLQWEIDTIDGVLFVSQTPDYVMPSTACIIQDKLGLKNSTVALDVNLGCSGYIYGLWMASQFIYSNTCKRVIVIVGDTISKMISPRDKGTALIFGDGVSATALERNDEASEMTFILKSDGSGAEHLMVPAGGFRNISDSNSKEYIEDDDGNIRNDENVYMNGMEIFGFGVKEIPKIIAEVVEEHGWKSDDIDNVLLHQANNYMIKYIAKKNKISMDKVPTNIHKFGNTGGATIPFLMCDVYKDKKESIPMNVVMSGFGVGLSWGAIAMELDKVHFSEFIYV
jgi:3-oxoacyl-[acyl-carrier-protein] synthase-3